jgi:hypothetical protein
MLRRSVHQLSKKSHQSALSTVAAREFTYFDNLEIKDGIAIIRLNGPGIYMNLYMCTYKYIHI